MHKEGNFWTSVFECGLRILNGRYRGDSPWQYTCFTARGCSVEDYAILSAVIQHRVVDFSVAPLQLFSDHCPLVFAVLVACDSSSQSQNVTNESLYSAITHSIQTPLRWRKEIFVKNLNDKEVKRRALDLKTSLPLENPNIGAKKLTTFLTELLTDDRSVKRSRKSRCIWSTKGKFPRNGWFDTECKAQKRLLHNAKKRFVDSPHNHSLLTAYFKTKSDYKRMTKIKKELAR